jgi:tetratricopeptide (TPR) repeat protein
MLKSRFVFPISLALLLSLSIAIDDASAKKNMQAEGKVKQDQYNIGTDDEDAQTIGMYMRFRPVSPHLGPESAWEVTITRISSEGLAADCGLQAGDKITFIDGKSTRYRRPGEVMQQFKGARGTPLVLSIKRGTEHFNLKFGKVGGDVLPALSTSGAQTKEQKWDAAQYRELRLKTAGQLLATAGSKRLAEAAGSANLTRALAETDTGRFALDKGSFADAEKALRRVLELDPSFVEARYVHALLLDQQKKYDEAQKILSEVVQSKPDFVEAWEALATAQQSAGNLSEAMQSYKKCAMLTTNTTMEGEFRLRIQQLQDLLVVPNAKPTQIASAQPAPEPVTEQDKLVAIIEEARKALDAKNIKLATEKFKAALELDPNNPNLIRQLAQCQQRVGNYAEAVTAFESYIKLVPDAPDMSQLKLNVVNLKNAMKTSPAKASPDGEDYLADMMDDFARWKKSTLKVYINDGKLVPGHQPVFDEKIKESFAAWSEASQGRLSFQYVSKPDYADILCLWTDDPSMVGSPLKGGATRVEPWGTEIMKATMHLLTIERGDKTKHIDAESARRLVLHEIGHALGLSGHSLNPKDIMFAFEGEQTQLSDRDKRTLVGLYAMKPPKPKPGSIPKTVVRMSH